MKKYLIIIVCILCACEGKLSDEQRKSMREQMELHKIKKISDTEITEAAFAKGRYYISQLEGLSVDSLKIDSVVSRSNGKIRWLEPGSKQALVIEQQLIDAYIADETGGMQDNVQDIRRGQEKTDSILYTKPVVTKLPDGSERLEGVWNIWLSRKELILEMDR